MKRLISLILAIIVLAVGALTVYAETIEELEERQRELEEHSEEYQRKLDESKAKVDEQQAYVDALVGKVQTVNAEISVIRQKIAALDADIAAKQKLIDQKSAEIEDNLNILRARLKAIYMAGDVSSLEIILGAKSFTDFFDKLQIVQYISSHDEALINSIKDQMDAISAEKQELQNEKQQQAAEKKKLEEKQQELNGLLEANEEVLATLQAATEDYQMKLELTEDELDGLSDEIQAYYRKIREEEERRKQQEQGGDNSGDDDTPTSTPSYTDVPSDGSYVWPTPGFYWLSSVFHEERSYEYHGGIDIAGAGIMNTPIYAAASGRVISTNYNCEHNWSKYYSCGCGGGYGNYVWIDHGNGKETIYGHMTTPVVHTGDYVYAGQLIGYVGSTGFSTGPHLHFECRYYGERYDPMSEYA